MLEPEFQQVQGLETLAKPGKGGRGPSGFAAPAPAGPTAPAAPASPVIKVEYDKLILGMLRSIDAAASAVLGVEQEQEADLKAPAEAIAPWVAVHAGDAQSETVLRLLALSGLVAFIGTKLIRYSQKPKPVKPRPNVATAESDELIPDIGSRRTAP